MLTFSTNKAAKPLVTRRLLHGDLFDLLPELERDSIDACVTDPPYGLGFMGKEWDQLTSKQKVSAMKQQQHWHQEWAEEVWRVLKPGAYLVAFGGTRTYHRLTCALEDADFEIRDCLCWLYGTGFPKSLNVSKEIDEQGTKAINRLEVARHIRKCRERAGVSVATLATWFPYKEVTKNWERTDEGQRVPSAVDYAVLVERIGADISLEPRRAAVERDIVGRSNGGLAQGWARDGMAGYQKEFDLTVAVTEAAKQWDGWGTALKPAWEPIILARKPLRSTVAENVLTYGTGALNIDACRIEAEGRPLRILDAKEEANGAVYAGRREAGHGFDGGSKAIGVTDLGRWPANVLLDEAAAQMLDTQTGVTTSGAMTHEVPAYEGESVTGLLRGRSGPSNQHGDSGGVSRFFYCSKASREERDLGCEDLPLRSGGEATDRVDGTEGLNSPRAGAGRTGGSRNFHPTVKPLALMRWLVKLITPPGGTVLDPFVGSGTTAMACVQEGVGYVVLDKEKEYVEIAQHRIDYIRKQGVENAKVCL